MYRQKNLFTEFLFILYLKHNKCFALCKNQYDVKLLTISFLVTLTLVVLEKPTKQFPLVASKQNFGNEVAQFGLEILLDRNLTLFSLVLGHQVFQCTALLFICFGHVFHNGLKVILQGLD